MPDTHLPGSQGVDLPSDHAGCSFGADHVDPNELTTGDPLPHH
ncbi:hypothetical protein ACIHJG_19455 [Streptomyces sp. NPDC052415]